MANKALMVNFRLSYAFGLQESVPRVRDGLFVVIEVAWWTKELGIKNVIMRRGGSEETAHLSWLHVEVASPGKCQLPVPLTSSPAKNISFHVYYTCTPSVFLLLTIALCGMDS